MGKSIYFIAEVGKACNGDFAYCEALLQACKDAGVRGVRFHHFFLENSVYPEVLKKSVERAWSFKLQLPFLNERLFSKQEYEKVIQLCAQLELDFIASPWDLSSFELFSSLGVDHYKVNSINVMNIPLVKRILLSGKRTYLSTGGLSEAEVEELCSNLQLSHYDVALLHAVLAYPAPSNIVNIRAIEILQKYHSEVGYSSNDLMKTSTLLASLSGASIIERHVHLEKEGIEFHKASIPVAQFAEEISNCQEAKVLMARKIKQESRGEMVNQDLLSKSLVLQKDLQKTDILTEENLSLLLPAKGVNAKSWFKIAGKSAAHPLNKGAYLFSSDVSNIKPEKKENKEPSFTPGKRGVVVRLKDIDEMIQDRNVDFVEVHYAAGDIDKDDICKEYDLDLVVHLPEYANGILLDLSSHNEQLRKFSIQVIDKVMQKARNLKPRFKRCEGPLKFIVHPGALTYLKPDPNPSEQYELFYDSLKQMDSSGLEILIENMTPFAWFLEEDWSPKQGMTNSFLAAVDLAKFCQKHNYSMCLDVCHAQLYCNHANESLYSFMKTVKPYVKHLHFSDCTGIDGEGLQIGDGEIDWQGICEVFEDYTFGWTPEIWHGHLDHGEKFYEAHDLLSQEFKSYFKRKMRVAAEI